MEYGTILVAADEAGEERIMLLCREPADTGYDDWNVLMLSGSEAGRVCWVPTECLAGEDATYVAEPR